MPPVLIGLLSWWTDYYGDHRLISVSIRFLHLAGIVLAGGTGLFSDRRVLRAARTRSEPPEAVLAFLGKTHTHVIAWLLVVIITGALMTAADTATFLVSLVYWIKMAAVALLVVNGTALVLLERRAARRGAAAVWPHVILASSLSAIFWLGALFMGVLLTVAA
jgi:hypothetical protein